MGVARKPSLEIEAALEVEGREEIRLGLGRREAEETTEAGTAGVSVFLFRVMIVVSSDLNFSRSLSAAVGEVKVKLWPLSSPKRAIFIFT